MVASDPPFTRDFTFVRRPTPVPADLRLSWRLPFLLIALGKSRGKKASLAKLHIVSDAAKNRSNLNKIQYVAGGYSDATEWRIRIEPAVGRAVDFLVGERLAEWVKVGGRAGVQLTAQGVRAYEALEKQADLFAGERDLLSLASNQLTEGLVTDILREGKAS
jgi:hypothetical protein